MQSRMDKYYENDIDIDDSSTMPSRTKKNQELYREVGILDLEDFDLNNNVSIIGDSTESISLDKIHDILSEKYRENNKRRSIGDTEEIPLPKINLDETREYDLNSILEKVKENKVVNYEEERLKKVRSSQYDILKDLDKLTNEEEIEEEDLDEIIDDDVVVEEKHPEVKVISENEKSERKLLDLIDTIVAKELIDDEDEGTLETSETSTGELDPLDILSDLRGDDDTKVMGAIHLDEESENILESFEEEATDSEEEPKVTEEIEYIEEDENNTIIENTEIKIKKVENDDITDSFITGSLKITEDDYDDFEDLKDNGGIGKVVLAILIVLIVILLVVGIIVFVNNF